MAAATGANSAASRRRPSHRSQERLSARRQPAPAVHRPVHWHFSSGTLAVVPAWYLMVPTKEKLEAFNPPATNMWRAVAELLAARRPRPAPAQREDGHRDRRPGRSDSAAAGKAVAQGWALPAVGHGPGSVVGDGFQQPARLSPSVRLSSGSGPSSMPARPEGYSVALASGFIAGESLIKAVIAMTATAIGLLASKL